jgi:hypothetical protein
MSEQADWRALHFKIKKFYLFLKIQDSLRDTSAKTYKPD